MQDLEDWRERDAEQQSSENRKTRLDIIDND